MMHRFSFALVSLAVITMSGCSNYNQRFAEASRTPVKGDAYAGTYAGKWMSSSHPGGGGKLRCILTPVDGAARGSERNYRADFHATWHGFSSEHSVVLRTKPSKKGKGTRDFAGTSQLRTIIGSGTYECEGVMDGRQIYARYDSSYDKGTFQVTRVSSDGASKTGGAKPSN